MSGKIRKIKLKFNNINISYQNSSINNQILRIKQVDFGNLNIFNTGDRRDKITVTIINKIINIYKYNPDNDNGNGQTEHNLVIDSDSTIADILMVAGGGGGGCRQMNSKYGSGGGGAGGLVFETNKKLEIGNYKIKVGKGGTGGSYKDNNNYTRNENGKNTEIMFESKTFLLAIGGGKGGNRNAYDINANYGKSGGSSGGSSIYNKIIIDSQQVQINHINSSYGNIGGRSGNFNNYYRDEFSGGGGGGAGSIGTTGDINVLPNGGNGIAHIGLNNFKEMFYIDDITIGEHQDEKVYFAGGGGGCCGYNKGGGEGGIGGGGNGEKGIDINDDIAEHGINNTGGGGGGGRENASGNGGSGIVIIKRKTELSNDYYQVIINNDNTSYYDLSGTTSYYDLNGNNDELVFNLSQELYRKDILNSLNQIIIKTEVINQIINLDYDVILENDEGEEILFETIRETLPNISSIDNSYSVYTRYFNLFTEEHLYPPYIFRDLPIITNNIFTISNRTYGNGNYEITYSSFYDNDNNPLNIFKNDFTSFTWNINNYTSENSLPPRDINSLSIYNKSRNINDYYGEFITIKLPNKILLTKFVLVVKDYNNVTSINLSKFPLYFKIFGRNTIENIWKEIVEVNINKNQLNNIYNDKYFINSYQSSIHIYNYEGTNDYKNYILELHEESLCDILIVAGGGAGGRSQNANRGGGGGGAGGLIYIEKVFLPSGTYNIKVGNGGQKSSKNGFDSSIINEGNTNISFIANGGGGGGNTGISNTNGNNGGSGGGGADYNGKGGNSNDNYGNDGGDALQPNNLLRGGSGAGGGGALTSGTNSNGLIIGNGGSGKIININGNDIEYAKGGDGGKYNDYGNGNDGTANRGNGGNGGNGGNSGNIIREGGRGGSGIVIIKKYINYYNSYKHVFDETNKRKTGLEIFEEYALVINKIGGETNVDFGTWEIYGKEKSSMLIQEPSNIPLKRNIKFSHLYEVFGNQPNNSSNISMEDYINYTTLNNTNDSLPFSIFKGLSIDSELPVKDNILARYIPNNIYMIYENDNIVKWNDVYNNYNITIITGSPSIKKITPNNNGLYTNNQRMIIPTITGTSQDKIEFPFTLPNDYTFCYIARYTSTSADNNKRIFNSKNDRTYWCFNNNNTCTSMYNDNIYSSQIKQISDNNYWIIGIETGDTMRYNGMDCTNYIYNSEYNINNTYIYNDDSETNSITINGGSDENYKGSWEIGELIFYNRKLTESEKIEIERYFAKKYYHISFSNVVNNITEYKNIISNNYSINNDIWYNIYDGNKYAYSVINDRYYGPANYLFDIKAFEYNGINYYYWILFIDNSNTDNTNKFLEVTIPNSDNNLYLITLAGGGSAGSYNDYSGDFREIISGPGSAGELNISNLEISETKTLQLQIGHGGKMIGRIGNDGGDSIIRIIDSQESLNSNKGEKGLDYDGSVIINVNGGTISSKLDTSYRYNDLFSLDDILTENYTLWHRELEITDNENSGIYYGYGAPGVTTDEEYSGSSGIVAIIQGSEIFNNIIT